MKEVDYSDRSSIFISDGYFNVALLYQRVGEEKNGFNHFGFHVQDIEAMRDRAERAGVPRGAKRPDRIPFAEYRLHDAEGNGIDISVKGRSEERRVGKEGGAGGWTGAWQKGLGETQEMSE